MSDIQNVMIMIGVILAIGGGFGIFSKYNIDRKNKKHKILSKKQKRELEKP